MARNRFGLIGKTLKHSFSPKLHKYLGDYSYELFELKPDELESFFKRQDLKAINITMPYKEEAMKYCNKFSQEALRMGCINTAIWDGEDIVGYNTDYYGCMEMLKEIDLEIEGSIVAILGDGSTSKTVRVALEDLGAKEILNISRRGEIKFDDMEKYNHVEVIVNATPVGMYPNNLESLLNLKDFPKLKAVADVVYNPLRTKLILDAKRLGIRTSTGLKMLVYQGIKANELFFDRKIEQEEAKKIYSYIYRDVSNIVIIGMPGSGKTSIGRSLAKKIDRGFVDLDREIEKIDGISVQQIFENYGEDGFREFENAACIKYGKETGIIISTGGGVVLDKQNFNPLKQNGIIVQIDRKLNKLATKGRPLSKGGFENLVKLQIERTKKYQDFADFKVVNIYHPDCVEDIINEFNEITGC
ncbi:shikimate kinase [Lagierella massiliensis]|uniref:shikimate kinase n=1 Tax=Lagierella massiliensis TaxID=1689303 RepID=UPI0006D794F2|nr:shikimate kinase [Lagierella massiliensis]